MDRKRILSRLESNGLYRLLKFAHDALTVHGIPYWISNGTLLGAVRHGGLIPHDDDGDLCIMRESVEALDKLRPFFQKHGYWLQPDAEADAEDHNGPGRRRPAASPCARRSCHWVISPMDGIQSGGLVCDIFVMYLNKRKGEITYWDAGWEHADNGGVRCAFPEHHVFPLRPYRFGNFYMMGPAHAVVHLNTCYGPDWNTVGMMLYDHRLGKETKGVKRVLSPEDYGTLEPPPDTCDHQVPDMDCAPRSKAGYFPQGKGPAKSTRGKASSKRRPSKSSKSLKSFKSSKRVARKASASGPRRSLRVR